MDQWDSPDLTGGMEKYSKKVIRIFDGSKIREEFPSRSVRFFEMVIGEFSEPLTSMMNENVSPVGTAEASGEVKYVNFAQAIGCARRDAVDSARKAAPKLRSVLEGAAHDMAYGAAFGACFAVAFARELVPGGIRRAWRRGAEKGGEAGVRAAQEGHEEPPPQYVIS